MHTTKVLHKLLRQSVPSIHAVRLKTFLTAVHAFTPTLICTCHIDYRIEYAIFNIITYTPTFIDVVNVIQNMKEQTFRDC